MMNNLWKRLTHHLSDQTMGGKTHRVGRLLQRYSTPEGVPARPTIGCKMLDTKKPHERNVLSENSRPKLIPDFAGTELAYTNFSKSANYQKGNFR